jgi:hypothetical protein
MHGDQHHGQMIGEKIREFAAERAALDEQPLKSSFTSRRLGAINSESLRHDPPPTVRGHENSCGAEILRST